MDVMGIISTIMGTVNKFVPDGDKQQELEAELQKLVATSNFQLLIRQADIGVEEAKNNRNPARTIFMCSAAVAVVYQMMVKDIIVAIFKSNGVDLVLPNVDMSVILKMLAWMFGIG